MGLTCASIKRLNEWCKMTAAALNKGYTHKDEQNSYIIVMIIALAKMSRYT